MDKNLLCEIMPIIEKAAPIIGGLLHKGKIGNLIGLLALLVNCNPHDEEEVAQRLKDDPDLFAKLKKLEETHGDWLKS